MEAAKKNIWAWQASGIYLVWKIEIKLAKLLMICFLFSMCNAFRVGAQYTENKFSAILDYLGYM
jgi:hypothetical protein